MAERDRLQRLEYDIARISRQLAGMPVRLARTSGSETYRLIRGQSVGVQSGSDIDLDNVVVLAGGVDPSGGNPVTTVSVANIFSQSYADNEYVDAIYSAGVTASSDWETLKTSTGTQSYRAIRGQCTANVLAGASTFSIDHIELLADSLDPRTTPGDSAETLTIHKEDVKTALRDNDWITAVYNDTDDQWELLATERYRAIRGTWYSGTSTLVIDNIVVLDNGLDPRSDPTSTTEQVSVTNVAGDTYGSGDKVYADWNAKDGVWEARPKGGGSVPPVWARVYGGDISAATDELTANWGSGDVKLLDPDTGVQAGSTTTVDNLWIGVAWADNSQVLIDQNFDPPRVVNGTCGIVTWSE